MENYTSATDILTLIKRRAGNVSLDVLDEIRDAIFSYGEEQYMKGKEDAEVLQVAQGRGVRI